MTENPLEFAFHPCSIAVVGASKNPSSFGFLFLRHLVHYGYQGEIYPVNPNLSHILGMKVYPSLRHIPSSVDYVICCIPAFRVPELLEECCEKGVRVVHLLTARLAETSRADAIKLEEKILRRARELGIRLIGPNCMGIYYPKRGLSFNYDFPTESGKVGAIFQSGGASTELVRYASLRGIRFSKVISYGNALDLNESDFLDYLSRDSETEIILIYIEGVKDGRKFHQILRNTASSKPVIVLKAGRGSAGTRAVVSHTASLAGSSRVWETVIEQAGAILVWTLEEMIDAAVSFYFLPKITGTRVGVAGGGGGRSVRSADEWEEAGFQVIPLPAKIREEVKNKAPEVWDWIGNPADRSIVDNPSFGAEDMLAMMAENSQFDLLIANVSEDAPYGKDEWSAIIGHEAEGFIKVSREGAKPLAVVLGSGGLPIEEFENWRWKLLAQQRAHLIAAQIPVYPSASRAAKAIRCLVDYYKKMG